MLPELVWNKPHNNQLQPTSPPMMRLRRERARG